MIFKQSDFQPCAICHRGMMHAGMPVFYRLKVERLGLDMQAIRRQHGLEMMMGAAAPLASIMGPNETMATVIDGPHTILICETCTHEHPALMQALLTSEEA